eukprot:3684155-Rhodomonas_salina.2
MGIAHGCMAVQILGAAAGFRSIHAGLHRNWFRSNGAQHLSLFVCRQARPWAAEHTPWGSTLSAARF